MVRLGSLSFLVALLFCSPAQACDYLPRVGPPFAVVDVVALETRPYPFGPDRPSALEQAQLEELRQGAFMSVTRFRVVQYLYGEGPDVIDVEHPREGMWGMCDWYAPRFEPAKQYLLTLDREPDTPFLLQTSMDVYTGEERRTLIDEASRGYESEVWYSFIHGD